MEKKEKKISIVYIIIELMLFVASMVFLACHFNPHIHWATAYYSFKQTIKCLAVSALLYILVYCVKFKVTKTLQIYFIIALMGHFIGGDVLDLYAQNAVYNYVLHIANSVFIGFIVYAILKQILKTKNKFIMFFVTFSSVIAIGMIWECYESTIDSIFGRNMQRFRNSITGEPFIGQRALLDTMLDVFMDMAGGIIAALTAETIKIKHEEIYKFFTIKIMFRRKAATKIEIAENVETAKQEDLQNNTEEKNTEKRTN